MDTDAGTHTPDHHADDTAVQKRRRFDRPFKNRRSSKKLTPIEAKRQLLDFYAAIGDCAFECLNDPSLSYASCNLHESATPMDIYTSPLVAPSKQKDDYAVPLPQSPPNTLSGWFAWSEC